MAFNNVYVDWRNIIKLSKEGLFVADYNQIRNAITDAFKMIYGDDIDTSTGTADGIYIDMYSLIINNILQAYKTVYSNLDVDQAQGKYLELLCALSNVFRKQATKSAAVLTCTLSSEETTAYSPEENDGSFSVLDSNGLTWTHKKDVNARLTWQPGQTLLVTVECDTFGPQSAPAGSITKLVNNNVDMTIAQNENAFVGDYAETDAALRSRRNQSLGAVGSTVLESLVGALLSSGCVKDVKLYNNASGEKITAKDDTNVFAHAVYILIRYANAALSSIDSYSAEIGSIIYNRLTPGILTTQYSGSSTGISKYYNYPVISRITGTSLNVDQFVYWKAVSPADVKITITLTKSAHYTDAIGEQIKIKLIEYLNDLQIGEDITSDDLKFRIAYYDSSYRGSPTYLVNSITINDSQSYTNKDMYYNVSTSDITIV